VLVPADVAVALPMFDLGDGIPSAWEALITRTEGLLDDPGDHDHEAVATLREIDVVLASYETRYERPFDLGPLAGRLGMLRVMLGRT
jgi:hypothetical protein